MSGVVTTDSSGWTVQAESGGLQASIARRSLVHR